MCIILLIASLGFSRTVVHAQVHSFGNDQLKIEVLGSCKHAETGEAAPSLIHVRQFDYPGISSGEWMDEILVSSDGSFVWELEVLNHPTLFELSAPPWSWMIVVRPNESAQLELAPGNQAQSLYGVSGFSNWLGTHPTNTLDSLLVTQRTLTGQTAASVMLRMNGVNQIELDSMAQEKKSIDDAYESAWSQARKFLKKPWEQDMLWHSKFSWMASQGSKKADLDSAWVMSGMSSDLRLTPEKLSSAGWLSAWRQVHGNWWKNEGIDWDAINAAVFQANRDSLERLMAPVLDPSHPEALELAWLDMALQQPSILVERVWESISMDPFFQDLYKQLLQTRRKGRFGWTPQPVSWILPNGDLDSLAGQCMQPWKIMLIVKDGSSAANREREYFNALIEEVDLRELCSFVVSVDKDEKGWSNTIALRKSIDEEVVWMGNNPQIFEDYGIESVPAIVTLNADGEISPRLSQLPSRGLASELKRLIRKQ
ncbi:MAG: hypothetical protein CL834_06990 [Crocinitomicaceae bacterium]|nr:hypothetical protein [Crocinitomicaceae bacterium]